MLFDLQDTTKTYSASKVSNQPRKRFFSATNHFVHIFN